MNGHTHPLSGAGFAAMLVVASCNAGHSGDDFTDLDAGPPDDGNSDGDSDPSSNCTSNPSPTFGTSVVDVAGIDLAIPPGLLTWLEPKGHSYLWMNQPASAAPIYAPTDMIARQATFYNTGVLPGIGSSYDVYLLEFEVSCEVTIWLDHLTDVVPKITSLLPSTPSNTTTGHTDIMVAFEEGELIGYAQPRDSDTSLFDFGLRNTSTTNSFANPSRWPEKLLYSDCPYDYFTSTIRDAYYARIGDTDRIVVGSSAGCRSVSIDQIGTAQGHWFSHELEGEGIFGNWLGIGYDVDQTAIVLASSLLGSELIVEDSDPTFLFPSQVTNLHCYSDGDRSVYLRMRPEAEELDVHYVDSIGGCPSLGEFPSDESTTFVR